MSDTEHENAADENSSGESDALMSRLRLIEDQPLESRAGAFSQIHQELQDKLESGDASHNRG